MTVGRDPEHLAAIGDSQSEGIGDPLDMRASRHGGLVNRLGDAWRTVPGVDFPVTNLAVAGATLAEMHDRQLAPALAARPDLVIVIGGVNDVRHDRPTDEVAAAYDGILSAILASGATVVTSRHPDLLDHVTLLPDHRKASLRVALARVRGAMDGVVSGHADAVASHRLLVVDHGDQPVPRNLFSIDQLHMNGRGHASFAQSIADLLGTAGWRRVIVPTPTLAPRHTVAHVGWLTQRYGPRLVAGLAQRVRG